MHLYNSLIKEQFRSEALGLDYIRTIKATYNTLNQSVLKRQRYNLIKEISEKFIFDNMAKTHITNYKVLASAYMIFEYAETDNPKQLMECKSAILANGLQGKKLVERKDPVIDSFESQTKDIRLLTYKLIIDKFNEKYSGLDEAQKQLLNKYIVNVNDTVALKDYIQIIIPEIKTQLSEQAKQITDKATKIKVKKLSEMLCTVENMKTIKESHVLSLLRYFDLVRELKEMHP